MKHSVTLEVENRVRINLTPDHKEATASGYGPHMSSQHEVLSVSDHSIALKIQGYSFNPGSKYSGLTTRIPTEIVVFVISKKISDRSFDAHAINAWNTNKKAR